MKRDKRGLLQFEAALFCFILFYYKQNMRHLFFFAAVIFLFGCGKNKKCNQADTFSGIVLEQLLIAGETNSNSTRVGFTSGFLIRNDSVYRTAFYNPSNLPSIDFAQYDLLGNYGNGYCKISFHKEVTADSAAKNYHYRLFVYHCSTYHQKGCSSYNWVLVPKLPQGWTVTFEVIKEKNK